MIGSLQLDYLNLTSTSIFNLDISNLMVCGISNNFIQWIYEHTNIKLVCLNIIIAYFIQFSLRIWILLLLHYTSGNDFENLYETVHL